MIDYKLIRALAAVVREGGFEKAARALHLTQSAVSQRVKLLEEQAGRVLLVRASPPRPTEAGRELLRHLRRVERLEGDLALALGDDEGKEADTLPVGVNADSLATWFTGAVRPFLKERSVLLDLRVADQDETHRLLKDGEVAGCVSAREAAMQGCRVEPLGAMVYRTVCTPGFAARWFAQGFTREAVENAPAVIYDHRDATHERMLSRVFGEAQAPPAHYVPSSERFVDFVADGLGYGMVPDLQAAPLLEAGVLMDLGECARGGRERQRMTVPVRLFWHCWNIESTLLAALGKALRSHAGQVLVQGEM